MKKKYLEFQKEARALFFDLWENRAHRVCEIQSKGCKGNWLLTLHHIYRRSDPKNCENKAEKCLVVCPECGNHANFHTGIKGKDGKAMPIDEQLALAEKLNKQWGRQC